MASAISFGNRANRCCIMRLRSSGGRVKSLDSFLGGCSRMTLSAEAMVSPSADMS